MQKLKAEVKREKEAGDAGRELLRIWWHSGLNFVALTLLLMVGELHLRVAWWTARLRGRDGQTLRNKWRRITRRIGRRVKRYRKYLSARADGTSKGEGNKVKEHSKQFMRKPATEKKATKRGRKGTAVRSMARKGQSRRRSALHRAPAALPQDPRKQRKSPQTKRRGAVILGIWYILAMGGKTEWKEPTRRWGEADHLGLDFGFDDDDADPFEMLGTMEEDYGEGRQENNWHAAEHAWEPEELETEEGGPESWWKRNFEQGRDQTEDPTIEEMVAYGQPLQALPGEPAPLPGERLNIQWQRERSIEKRREAARWEETSQVHATCQRERSTKGGKEGW